MIKNTQIIQVTKDCLILKIVPLEGYKEEILNREIKELAEGLRNIVGGEISIQSEIVENIQLTKAGKFKWIISDIAKDFLVKGV
jgi:phenylacetate-CoA ligase